MAHLHIKASESSEVRSGGSDDRACWGLGLDLARAFCGAQMRQDDEVVWKMEIVSMSLSDSHPKGFFFLI